MENLILFLLYFSIISGFFAIMAIISDIIIPWFINKRNR